MAQRITLAKLAESLTRILGAPVTDMTAKDGVFSFTIEWTPDAPRPAANAAAVDSPLPEAPSGPSIFTVLQQELGLKLESRKVPVEAIVVDRAEKPIEN